MHAPSVRGDPAAPLPVSARPGYTRRELNAIFTTMRVRRGRPWLWPEHVVRLRDGASYVHAAAPDADALLAEIERRTAAVPDARVRVTVRSDGAVDVDVAPAEPPVDAWTLAPVRVEPAEEARRKLVGLRARYYEPARAAAAPADDALLVAPDGAVLEATVANVFFVLDGELVTPSGDAPLLAGIVRGRLLAAGRASIAARIGLDQIADATACVATNALIGVHPVAEIRDVARFDSARLARTLMATLTAQTV
jgi:4-amino-4-deoxychorismate lyase